PSLHLFVLSLSIIPPPLTPTLFPYTTLFRSIHNLQTPSQFVLVINGSPPDERLLLEHPPGRGKYILSAWGMFKEKPFIGWGPIRSEEHTSELQSLTNLVCRLLLEKKKKHLCT